MKYLFSFKKDVLGSLLLCAIAVSSCTNEDEVLKSSVEPGIYIIEKTINAQETRGVNGNNHEFDQNYEATSLYLYCGEEVLKFPVYNAGFRFHAVVDENGDVTITPINESGGYESESITISEGDDFYFSSWESEEWELLDSQKGDSIYLETESFASYLRNSETNQELYRSPLLAEYTIDDLLSNDNLIMQRACAGFTLLSLFYDGADEDLIPSDSSGITTLTEEEFKTVMGDEYTNWYIKIIIGGDAFPEKYNIGKMTIPSDTTQTGGYYSTGDIISTTDTGDKCKYVQFSSHSYGSGSIFHNAFGYYSTTGTHLFTPVTGNAQVDVYVMIKHWTETGEPSEEWLVSDEDAIYTKVDLSSVTLPENNRFYMLGLLMDIAQFKNAWDAIKGSEEDVMTRSLGLKASREFFLKDAKVIFESY